MNSNIEPGELSHSPTNTNGGGLPAPPPQSSKPKRTPLSSSPTQDNQTPMRASTGMINPHKPLPRPPGNASPAANSPLSISDGSPSAAIIPTTPINSGKSGSHLPHRFGPLPSTPVRASDSGVILSANQNSPTSLLPPPAFGPPPQPPPITAAKIPPHVPARRADLTLSRSRPNSPARSTSNRASMSSSSPTAATVIAAANALVAQSPTGGSSSTRNSLEVGSKDRSELASDAQSDRSEHSASEDTHHTTTGISSSSNSLNLTVTPAPPHAPAQHAPVTSGSGMQRASDSDEVRKSRAKSNPLASLISSALRPSGNSFSSSSSIASTSGAASLPASSSSGSSGSSGGSSSGLSTSGSSGSVTKVKGSHDEALLSKLRRSIVGERSSSAATEPAAAPVAAVAEPNWFVSKPAAATTSTGSAPSSLRQPVNGTLLPGGSTIGSSLGTGSSNSLIRARSTDNVSIPDRPPPLPPSDQSPAPSTSSPSVSVRPSAFQRPATLFVHKIYLTYTEHCISMYVLVDLKLRNMVQVCFTCMLRVCFQLLHMPLEHFLSPFVMQTKFIALFLFLIHRARHQCQTR